MNTNWGPRRRFVIAATAILLGGGARAGGLASTLLIGAIAGLMPAIRAARLSPTEALRTV